MKHLLVLSMLLTINAYADVIVEESGSKAIFLVNEKQVSPVDAQEAARDKGSKVQRCTPIKDALTGDGKPAYKCKHVVLVINPKTGTTKWKNI